MSTPELADAPPLTGLAEPHHDGSEAYVLESPEELGGEAVLRLRVPRGIGVDRIALRYTDDGEARFAVAERDDDEWWIARFEVQNPAVSYRWLLGGGEVGYAWVNGLGLVSHDVPDADDFVLSVRRPAPEWHLESVVYEIFPDRFARGIDEQDWVDPEGDWAIESDWDTPIAADWKRAVRQLYRGDLVGVR